MHIKKSTDSQLFIDISIIVDNIYVQLTVQLRTVLSYHWFSIGIERVKKAYSFPPDPM